MFRANRAENFKSKCLTNYGNNSLLYEVLKKYKDDWERYIYLVDEHLVERFAKFSSRYHLTFANDIEINSIKTKQVDEIYFNARFKSNLKINVVIEQEVNEHERILGTLETIKIADNETIKRLAYATAVGGCITSMQWLPENLKNFTSGKNTQYNYLAIGVINSGTELLERKLATSREISVFNSTKPFKKKELESAIQLWRYDTITNQFTLQHIIITLIYGAVSDIKWAPVCSKSEDIIGTLVATFKDGTIRVLKIPHSLARYSVLEESSLTFYSDKHSKEGTIINSNLTCFAFHEEGKILAGTADGFLMEFELFETGAVENGPSLPPVPNYKFFVSDGPITHIESMKTFSGETIILINGQAFRGTAFMSENPIQEAYSPVHEKSNVKPTYNCILQDVLVAYNLELAKILNFRSLQDGAVEIIRVSSHISACKMSEVLGHPFMIAGTSAGDVILMNYARKLFSRRGKNKVLQPLKLWKLTWDTKSHSLSIKGNYERIEVESIIPASFMPQEVLVNSVAWNENAVGSSIYAVGTASGLLIVERLDPTTHT